MRAALVVLLLSSTAFAQAPPSKTLERAIKLYDKKDFYSTSIELRKVIDGETNDDDAGKQRAQFFLGKTLYQMGYYAAANAVFEQIATNPRQTYNTASAKWTAALLRVLPFEDVPALRAYTVDTADDPGLASVRDELLYAIGRAALDNSDYAAADKAFAKVATESEFYAHARLGLAISAARAGDAKRALAAFQAVPPRTSRSGPPPYDGPDAFDLAQIGIAGLAMDGKKWDDAAAAATKVASSGGLGPRAAWEVVLAKAGKRGTSLGALQPYARTPVVSLAGPEPVLLQLVASCSDKDDALGAFRHDSAALVRELDALAQENPGDDADLADHRAVSLHAGTGKLSARANALVKAMLASPSFEHALAFRDELDHELANLSQADKAWQATAVAAQILQELTIVRSVSDAELGKLLRARLRALAHDAHVIASDTTKLACN